MQYLFIIFVFFITNSHYFAKDPFILCTIAKAYLSPLHTTVRTPSESVTVAVGL